jgi:quercetin dioxygenase-like cupin family protein
MATTPARVRRFSSAIGADAVRSGDGIRIAPALGRAAGGSMSAYTASFSAGARAGLPAPYAEVWVVLDGALRVGAEHDAVTVRTGDFVHVPEQAPGVVEALEDTTNGLRVGPRALPARTPLGAANRHEAVAIAQRMGGSDAGIGRTGLMWVAGGSWPPTDPPRCARA